MSKKKNVLFITNIPAPYRVDFYNELGKEVDLTVIFEAKSASNQGIKFNWNYDEVLNFKAIYLSEGDINERKIDWRIFKYLNKKIYDEIVVTNYSYFTEMFAILYLKLLRINYYMETDGGIIRKENMLKKFYKRFLVQGAKGYFSPSRESDKYLQYYGAKNIKRYPFTSISKKDIVSNPITSEEKQMLRQELQIKEKKVILGVGQFIPRKGWDILLKAADGINDECGIYIVGGKASQDYIELAKKKRNSIHFLDFMGKDELKKYYKASDLFVLPTREDIWGLVINEALSYGLPVVTTENCVAGLELVKDGINGYIVPCDNVEELAVACNNVLQGDLEQFSLNAIKMMDNCTIEAMAEIHARILG